MIGDSGNVGNDNTRTLTYYSRAMSRIVISGTFDRATKIWCTFSNHKVFLASSFTPFFSLACCPPTLVHWFDRLLEHKDHWCLPKLLCHPGEWLPEPSPKHGCPYIHSLFYLLQPKTLLGFIDRIIIIGDIELERTTGQPLHYQSGDKSHVLPSILPNSKSQRRLWRALKLLCKTWNPFLFPFLDFSFRSLAFAVPYYTIPCGTGHCPEAMPMPGPTLYHNASARRRKTFRVCLSFALLNCAFAEHHPILPLGYYRNSTMPLQCRTTHCQSFTSHRSTLPLLHITQLRHAIAVLHAAMPMQRPAKQYPAYASPYSTVPCRRNATDSYAFASQSFTMRNSALPPLCKTSLCREMRVLNHALAALYTTMPSPHYT